MPCAWPVTPDMKNPAHYPVAVSKACYVGDGVAVVLATSEAAAQDAVGAIDVQYEPLDAVIGLEAALSDQVVIHDDLGTNKSYTWELKVGEEAVDAAFATAAHTVKERYIQQRLIPMAMEPRAVAAVPQPYGGGMTLYSATQIPHILKIMTALTLGIPEHQMRVVAPSVGGAFGSKLNVYAEELLCVALAKKHGVPVRWNEERTENALATIQGRGQIQDIELAADADGKLTAIRVRLLADMGAYLQLVTPGIPLLGAFLYAGVYDLPAAYDFSCTSVFTTMTPTDAYRGAGRPEATYAIERAMDALAAEIGVDPMELRKRNFIKAEQFPYTAFSGLVYDSGDHLAAAEKAAGLADYEGIRAKQQMQNVPGATKRLGIGLSSYFEMCGLAPSRVLASLNYAAGGWETATVRVLPTHKVQVVTGTAPHGQGHETAWVHDRGRQARRAAGRRGRAPLRHRHQPDRPRHVRLALAGRRGRGHRHGVRPDHRQGPADRRAPARGRPRGPRVRAGQRSTSGARRRRRSRSRRSRSRPSPPTTCPTAWSPTSRRTVTTTHPTSRGPSAPTSAWSRSTPRPAASTCSSTSPSTTAACRSTR